MTRGRMAGIVAAVVVAVVLGVVLAGRNGGSPVAAAATRSTSAGGAHVAFSLTLRGPKLGGKTIDVSGSGAVDDGTADITIQDSGAPAALPPSLHLLLVRQDGHELAFVHATPMPSLALGKDWVEVDLTQLAASHGIHLGALAAGAAGETPAQILDLLRSAGANVDDLGAATVDGISTTHYRVLVDAAELARAAGLPIAPAGKAATATVPVNVWIGTDGLVRRVALDVAHGSAHASFTATLSDYGSSVSVSAPTGSDVFDLTGLLGGGAGGIQPLG